MNPRYVRSISFLSARLRAATLAFACLACRQGAAQPAVPAAPAPTIISYGTSPDQVLDLYQPMSPGLHRLVVFVHGGSWRNGNKAAGGRQVASGLTPEDYAVASVEYRKVPENTPRGEAEDVAQAIGFLRRHAADLHLDTTRLAIMGHSSGGHLAALIGTDPAYLDHVGVGAGSLAAVIILDGVFDIAEAIDNDGNPRMYKAIFGNDPAQWRAASPAALAASTPVQALYCLAHEDTVPRFAKQALLFETALRRRGEQVETLVAPGLSHVQLVRSFALPGQPMARFVLGCLRRAFATR